ncbi:hypothetical protein [Rhodococcus baikonurensis]|uniref:hypothetical protein n=1 Tax=Rhodococcus baikonurensis TaxID=172041 RepID=UPI0037C582AE
MWIQGGHTFPDDDLQGIGILIKTSVVALAGGTPVLTVIHNDDNQFNADGGRSLLDEIVCDGARKIRSGVR